MRHCFNVCLQGLREATKPVSSVKFELATSWKRSWTITPFNRQVLWPRPVMEFITQCRHFTSSISVKLISWSWVLQKPVVALNSRYSKLIIIVKTEAHHCS